MKIINVVENSQLGGPQLRILAVAKLLREQHVSTCVVCPQEPGGYAARLEEESIPNHPVRMAHMSKDPRLAARFLITFVRDVFILFRLFRKSNAQLVHCNGVWQIKGFLAAKLTGKRVVWHLNDTNAPLALRILFEVLSPFADAFICTSSRSRDYYFRGRDCSKPLACIQAPVDTKRFDPAKSSAAPGLADPGILRVVTVANLNPIKDYDVFLDCAARLMKEFDKRVEFIVVGAEVSSQKNYIRYLKGRVATEGLDTVRFWGSRSDVRPILAAADVFAFTSRSEAGPMAVWEAMAMALPVVTTDVGGVSEYIRDGVNGFVVPVEDVDSLTSRVMFLLKNQSLRRRIGRLARETAVRELDVANCALAHKRLYEAALGDNS